MYANRFALDCFGYRESEMLALPSRLSAEASFRRTVAIEYHFSLT
ncbi:hypothetical protein [Pectobacterium sp. PL152]|nr:MEKHLA domain-containing protein [Pectobacterium sp. PL152]